MIILISLFLYVLYKALTNATYIKKHHKALLLFSQFSRMFS